MGVAVFAVIHCNCTSFR